MKCKLLIGKTDLFLLKLGTVKKAFTIYDEDLLILS